MWMISMKAVLDIVSQYCPDDDGSCSKAGVDLREMLDEIEGLDETEVVPVRYGRWELITQNKFTGTKTLRCTYCKNYFVVRDDTLNAGRGDANFCPNCGSENRMDGDSDD